MSLSNIIKHEDVKNGKVQVEDINTDYYADDAQYDPKRILADTKEKQKLKTPLTKADFLILQAETILEEAKKKASEIERESYEKGFAEGEKAGIEFNRQKLAPLLRNIDTLIEDLAGAKELIIFENEQELIKIAFLIATRIIHKEINQDEEIILDVVKTSIEKTIKGGKVTLKVNPIDYDYLIEHGSKIDEIREIEGSLQIEKDSSIVRGGCIVITNAGEIDATIDNQLKVLKNALFIQE